MIVLLLPALVASISGVQDLPPVTYPKLAPTAANAEGFVPKGWRIESRDSGDLDGDGLPDLALALKQQDPANIVANKGLCGDRIDTNPRILVVALAQRGGGYRLAVQNHSLIPRYDHACAEDWFASEGVTGGGMEVVRGTVRIRLGRFMSAGGWGMGATTYTFRWQQGALRLIGYDYTNVQRNTGEMDTQSINYLTRRMKTSTGSISDDAQKTRWSTIPARPLLTIDQVGNGMDFDPDSLLGKR
ncbi:hypothetical protein TPR58_15205 [Sphingomonas sp. HF-S3]|uniref:VCBS repeat-containing protein n=1 Tax=Sphingomonas rustica TaxID=3103142 RepID=A0ABV0BBB0_9SPHN